MELVIGVVIGIVATLIYTAWVNGKFSDGVQLNDFNPKSGS